MPNVCKQNDLRPKSDITLLNNYHPASAFPTGISFIQESLVEMFNCIYLFTSRSIVNTIGP